MADTEAKSGDLPVTLATFLFILSSAGHPANHEGLKQAIEALNHATPDDDIETLGKQLVSVVREGLGEDADLEQVQRFMGDLYSDQNIATKMGNNREERLRSIRSYMFQNSLPWIARIIDRFPDGTVGPHWVMIEQVTDRVICMDPYPWDDLDEEYASPVVEFMVKWELAGCESIRFQRA
ncbi:MAG: hypothetical protein AAFV53_12410 [Myxococcota bacterium]